MLIYCSSRLYIGFPYIKRLYMGFLMFGLYRVSPCSAITALVRKRLYQPGLEASPTVGYLRVTAHPELAELIE